MGNYVLPMTMLEFVAERDAAAGDSALQSVDEVDVDSTTTAAAGTGSSSEIASSKAGVDGGASAGMTGDGSADVGGERTRRLVRGVSRGRAVGGGEGEGERSAGEACLFRRECDARLFWRDLSRRACSSSSDSYVSDTFTNATGAFGDSDERGCGGA